MIFNILGWITTAIFILPFMLVFPLFHLPLVIGHKVFGYQAQKKVLDYLQITIITLLRINGFTFRVRRWQQPLPKDRPLIIVSNHQSIFDIPFLIWVFRRHHPKFVSKKELGRGIPTTSYYLRHGGNALIDRKDKVQSLKAISDLGEYIEKNTRSAIIFPEGSRSKNGILKEFKTAGVLKLIEKSPSALVVPVVIENSWQIVKNNFKPIPFGIKCKLTVLEPIEPSEYSNDEIMKILEERIRVQLKQEKTGVEI